MSTGDHNIPRPWPGEDPRSIAFLSPRLQDLIRTTCADAVTKVHAIALASKANNALAGRAAGDDIVATLIRYQRRNHLGWDRTRRRFKLVRCADGSGMWVCHYGLARPVVVAVVEAVS